MIPNLTSIEIDPKEIKGIPIYDEREAFLLGLSQSIKEHGLWFPPIITDTGLIVSGKKRVIATLILGLPRITCSVVSSKETEEFYSILRLHENLKRKNLDWHEELLLEKELHDLHIKEYGQRGWGAVGAKEKETKKGWSLRDTAKELEMSFGVLSEDVRMAEAIIADPSLKRIKDKKTARKVIFEQWKRITQEQDSGAVAPTVEINTVHCGGSDIILQMYPNNTFDCCLTDPPWLRFKDITLTKDEFTLNVFKQIYRVLKQNSFLYAFVSTPDFKEYCIDLPKIGFQVQEIPLIWIKEGVLTQGTRSWEYQRSYELILLAVKGSPALTSSMLSPIFSTKVVHSSKLIHPNEKPVEVIKQIIEHSTYDNALILDPFAGSGVVGVAAKQMRRNYVLIEKDKQFYSKIMERLK